MRNSTIVHSKELKSFIKKNKSSFSSKLPKSSKYWTKSITKLLMSAFLIAFAVFTLVFILVNLIPGNPLIIDKLIADKADEATIKAMMDKFYLNDPYIIRYFKSLGDMFNGSLGTSGTYGVNVSSIIFEKLLLSFQIGFMAIGFSIIIGIPFGIFLARRKSTGSDIIAAASSVLAFSIPTFVFGILFMYISFLLGLPIIFEFGNWYTLLIPSLVISIPVGLTYSRYLRSSIREEYQKQYVALARIKGASERKLLWSHIIKPALYPVATYFPIIVTMALFGSITVESVFSIPGTGTFLVDSAIDKDQAALLAISTIYTIAIVISFFLRDIMIRFIDPRVRTS